MNTKTNKTVKVGFHSCLPWTETVGFLGDCWVIMPLSPNEFEKDCWWGFCLSVVFQDRVSLCDARATIHSSLPLRLSPSLSFPLLSFTCACTQSQGTWQLSVSSNMLWERTASSLSLPSSLSLQKDLGASWRDHFNYWPWPWLNTGLASDPFCWEVLLYVAEVTVPTL